MLAENTMFSILKNRKQKKNLLSNMLSVFFILNNIKLFSKTIFKQTLNFQKNMDDSTLWKH